MISICMITIRTKEEVQNRIDEACNNATGDFEFILISNPKGGVAENRNLALKKAKGEIICFVDDDIYNYSPKWNEILINKLAEDKNCLMIGPRLFNQDTTIQNTVSKCNDLVHDYIKVPYLPGAVMCYRKNNLLFDENYIGWGLEDIEFQLELKKINPQGYFLLTNKLQLKHVNEMKREKEFGLRNKELFRRKHGFLIE